MRRSVEIYLQRCMMCDINYHVCYNYGLVEWELEDNNRSNLVKQRPRRTFKFVVVCRNQMVLNVTDSLHVHSVLSERKLTSSPS